MCSIQAEPKQNSGVQVTEKKYNIILQHYANLFYKSHGIISKQIHQYRYGKTLYWLAKRNVLAHILFSMLS